MTDPSDFWDQRFAAEGYLFGTEPAGFLTRHAHFLTPDSRVLAIADGEGRNSVFLARQGMAVTAMERSAVALKKARALAEKAGVTVQYHQGDVTTWDWDAVQYDAVVGICFQFLGPEARAEVFAGLDRALVPGGLLMLHGYAPRQVEYGTGGPPFVANMYDLALLKAAFPGYDVLHAADFDADIQEGRGHSGLSAQVDFVARKPAQVKGN